MSKPLVLRDGKTLRTLADVRALILAMPAGYQDRQAWAKAAALLLDTAENGGDIQVVTNATGFALFLEANVRLE